MSNRNPDERSGDRKSKVSLAMTINQGLGGPKANPKGVVDGQPVNIPALLCLFLKATENWGTGALLDLLLFGGSLEFVPDNPFDNSSQKNFEAKSIETVPQTDTGGLALVCQGQRVKAPEGIRQKS